MTPLVTPSWLAGRLDDPKVVILDATLPPVGVTPSVDTRARYLEQHIPGAVFFDIDGLSDRSTTLPHMLPSEEEFARSMSAMGVSGDATIVVYEQDGVFSAPRAWWMLRVFGAQDVRLLNGGLRAWIESGLPTESGPITRLASTFHTKLDHSCVADFAGIQSAIRAREQILDARSAGRFAGTALEPRPGISSGHMPGSISLPFTELTEDGRLRPLEELRTLFQSKGVDVNRPVTTTCGSGVTAAVLALGLEIAGAKQVRLYDGSWAEYAMHPDAVIEKSA
ncbi:MAG TPA: 3-mercaptopyruvate sulfurtransferase [Acidobacteriaceae bacterium]|nr:3-mercaptopyruvate sulfurtransferase [Acidobacteriaceae bacterium]